MPLNEWLESNLWVQWFLVWQTIGSDGFSMVLVWPTIGTNGFSMVFPIETMVFQWFWVWQTIGTNGFSMVFSLETMVFQWFPMVANHWSNDGMVTIHRRGLSPTLPQMHFLPRSRDKIFYPKKWGCQKYVFFDRHQTPLSLVIKWDGMVAPKKELNFFVQARCSQG